MANYKVPVGIQVSLDNSTFYDLSDHNRQPIDISYELIENSQRMANGTMRKYVVAKKQKISTSWENVPSLSSNTVDSKYGAAWLKAFYEAYCFYPIYVKITYAQDSVPTSSGLNLPNDSSYADSANVSITSKSVFMTSFDYTVNKRMRSSRASTAYDYVNVKIEFTEI